MAPATLTINSRNYGSWSLRGWLLCRMAGLDFTEEDLQFADKRDILLRLGAGLAHLTNLRKQLDDRAVRDQAGVDAGGGLLPRALVERRGAAARGGRGRRSAGAVGFGVPALG